MSELGDLSGFLDEGSEYPLLTKEAGGLDWLSVSEEEYRKLETLPQQNFEVMPELEKAWAEGRSSTLVPVKDYRPAKVMTAPVVIRPEEVAKTARFALMSGQNVVEALLRTYDKTSLREARSAIASVVEEKGLLGPFYVLASDFEIEPGRYDARLIRKYASDARYVLGKIACGCGCGGSCNPFRKPEVQDLSEVYTDKEASLVEAEQVATGKHVVASVGLNPRDRIRNAYLAKIRVAEDLTPKPVVNPAQFLTTPKQGKVHLPVIAQERARLASLQANFGPSLEGTAFEVGELLKREILKGGSQTQVLTALKVAFSKQDLRATRESWEPLFKEAGILGTVYSFQEAFDACSEGADFLDRHNSPVSVIVAGPKCEGCPNNRLGECTEYNRSLVASVEDALTPQAVAAVARAKLASVPEGLDIRSQLRSLYLNREGSTTRLTPQHYQEYVPANPRKATASSFKEALLLTASNYVGKGMRGPRLLAALEKQFPTSLIAESVEDLRGILAQGTSVKSYPSIGSDTGRQMLAEFEMGSRSFDFDLEERVTLPPLDLDLERK